MNRRKHIAWTRRAVEAYQKRWKTEYVSELDDGCWWKWLLGYDSGYRAGLKAGKATQRQEPVR